MGVIRYTRLQIYIIYHIQFSHYHIPRLTATPLMTDLFIILWHCSADCCCDNDRCGPCVALLGRRSYRSSSVNLVVSIC